MDFVIIGASKCGSTSLQQYLARHPDLYLPLGLGINDETGLFLVDRDERVRGQSNRRIRGGRTDDEILQAIFAGYSGESLVGERSTDYSKSPHRTTRHDDMASHNRNVKIIYIVRDPLQQMLALHRHYRRRRPELTETDPAQDVAGSVFYRDIASYLSQLQPYLNRFPREQIHVMLLEDLEGDTEATLASVFSFLGVRRASIGVEGRVRYNTNDQFREVRLNVDDLPTDWRRHLHRELDGLQVLLDRDLASVWPSVTTMAT